jgi:hypothetical protein
MIPTRCTRGAITLTDDRKQAIPAARPSSSLMFSRITRDCMAQITSIASGLGNSVLTV